MLRKKKDNSDYEIDRELTWKFAIEKNAEYQDRIAELEEENKKLKSDLAFERTMLDNVRAEYKSSQEVIKKLKEKIERWEKCFKKWFNPQDVEYLMEEDTLQELRDLGKI